MTNENASTVLPEARLSVPDGVLMQELDGESVFLNLNSERYFGLDSVGTQMWKAITTSESIQQAYEQILVEYDVEPDRLRNDLFKLIERLVEHGLVKVGDK